MKRKVNVNQLISLQYLLEEKHVSRAAKRANVSQPAMSKTLQSLRDITGNPLLYREGNDMKITPYAKSILKKLTPALSQLDEVLSLDIFDESISTEEFTIAASDYFSSYALPEMLMDLSFIAPNIKYEILSLNKSNYKALESGNIDIAATEFIDTPNLPDGVESVKIGEDGLVCIMNREHELANKEMSIEDYKRFPHISVSDINSLVGQCLFNIDYLKMVKLTVPYYSTAVKLAQKSNYLFTVPLHIAARMSKYFKVKFKSIPSTSLKINYFLLWPKLKNHEESHQWLRTKLLKMMESDFEKSKSAGMEMLVDLENNVDCQVVKQSAD